jgi:hypothetical protein
VLFKKDGNATEEPHDLLMVGPDGYRVVLTQRSWGP